VIMAHVDTGCGAGRRGESLDVSGMWLCSVWVPRSRSPRPSCPWGARGYERYMKGKGGRIVRWTNKRIRRLLVGLTTAGLLSCCLFLTVQPATAEAATFLDVRADDWFAEAVEVLYDAGIVQGKADGTFRPYEPISRAEFTVLLNRSLGLASGAAHPFTDFPAGSWFEPAVAALYEAGLVQGLSPSEFNPEGRLSRQQAASFIIRALEYRLTAAPVEGLDLTLAPDTQSWLQGFPDREFIATVHQPAVANAYRLGIVSGQLDGRFYPLAEVTRGQTAGMLYAALFQRPVPRTEIPAPASANSVYPSASAGASGPHVLWLEQRLAQLTYRPGAIDGVFDERTRHAVIAFQKWESLARDGMVGPATWVRLATGARPTARQSGSGIWIEVSLAKQVFLYVENGVVTRTLPTSTGASFTYRSAPYTVQRKAIADGPRYRALYINPGYVLAIHGYPSVPIYPASDGCVRLPMWEMDALRAQDATNPLIPDGTRVYIS